MNESHNAYRFLRTAMEGKLPPGNTTIRKAYNECMEGLRSHFNGLNRIQEIYFQTVVGPRILFLIQCPMKTEKGTLHSDWEKMSKMVENGLDRMARMADAPQSAPKKEDWLKVVSRDD